MVIWALCILFLCPLYNPARSPRPNNGYSSPSSWHGRTRGSRSDLAPDEAAASASLVQLPPLHLSIYSSSSERLFLNQILRWSRTNFAFEGNRLWNSAALKMLGVTKLRQKIAVSP
eukprot:GHVU01064497.1.p1 GENE.GHVU01064497.1~~GHVU01064497.1.p1  ORF type:complete len:116 (-),score=6.13 GHVU01064497.1:288-635(-)